MHRQRAARALIEPLEGRRLYSGTVRVVTGVGYYTGPVARPAFETSVVAAGASNEAFHVFFSGPALDLSSILGNTSAVRVTGPGGAEVVIEPPTEQEPSVGPYQRFVYTIQAPGGRWDAADNGEYVVTQLPGQIKDAEGRSRPQEVTVGRFNVTLPAAGPDIVTAVESTVPAEAPAGTRAGATVTVRNVGNASFASHASVQLSLNSDDADYVLATRFSRVKLAPGQSKTFRLRFAVPTRLADGMYQLTAHAVATNVPELDETNNAATGPTPIHVIPDTMETAVSIVSRPDAFTRGETGEVKIQVDNAAASAAKNTRVTGSYLIYSNALRRNFSEKFTADVAAGASQELTLTIEPPATLPPGTYTMQVAIRGMRNTLQINGENDLVLAQVEIL